MFTAVVILKTKVNDRLMPQQQFGQMGVAALEPNQLHSYKEIYETTYTVLSQTHHYRTTNSDALFGRLFSCFCVKNGRYDWLEVIPVLMRKYFEIIIKDVREKAIEELYMMLNIVLLKEDSGDSSEGSPEKHESKFLRKISSEETVEPVSALNASSIVRDSLLFEDDVVYSCVQSEKPSTVSMFRESVLSGSAVDKNQTIMKGAIFIENLCAKDKQEISFFVSFYHRFSQILEGMISSVTFCSLFLRHFELSMKEKRARKKLKTSSQISLKSNIYKDGPEGENTRRRQKYNQALLLDEVSLFVQLYTSFIWEFYRIEKMQTNIQYATLISYENINSLVLNSVWGKVSWVGQRGCQYEEELLKHYLLNTFNLKDLKDVSSEALEICRKMSISPMKYLKEVTLVYREIVSKGHNTTADDLLLVYNSLFYLLATEDQLKGKLRMVEIVNIIWAGEKNGEVGYAWITWEAALGMLFHEASKFKLSELI